MTMGRLPTLTLYFAKLFVKQSGHKNDRNFLAILEEIITIAVRWDGSFVFY